MRKTALRSILLAVTLLLLPESVTAASESKATLLFVSDTYGCLGYPGWPGGVARLKTTVAQLRQNHPGAPLVHTGNAISPFYFSRFDDGRTYSSSLDQVGGVIWNLGFHDLDYGWAHLSELRRAMPHTELLSSNLTVPSTPPATWLTRTIEGVRVGFIGVIEPRAEHLTRIGRFAGLATKPPLEAVRQAVASHRSEVDLLVVVCDLAELDAEALTREAVGVDLVVSGSRHEGDWYTFHQGRPPNQLLERKRPDGSRIWLVSGPRDGFDMTRVTVTGERVNGRWQVARLDHEVVKMPATAPQDSVLESRVNEQLKRIDQAGQQPIIADLAARFGKGGITGDQVTRWSVSALRRAVGAEIAILNQGALFKVDHWAETATKDDRLADFHLDSIVWADNEIVKLKILGTNLLELLSDDQGHRLRFSGLTRTKGAVLVNGRPLVPAEHYLVATTNYLVAESPKSRGFDKALAVSSKFKPEDDRWEAASGGSQLGLRQVIRSQLLQWSKQHPKPDGAEPLAHPDYPSQQTVIFRNINVGISDYDARNNEAFPRVRNPRIATSDVRIVQGGGEVFTSTDSPGHRWDHGTRFEFNSLRFPGGGLANPVDDLVFYSRYLDRERTVTDRLHPFAELAYDTEFTPTRGNPRDQLYRLSIGLSEDRRGPLRGFRIAALVEHDRSALANTEYGLSTGFNLRRPLGPVRLESDTEARTYFDSSDDTADDLQVEIYSANSIIVPVTCELSVSFMANLFAYRGKIVEEDGANLFLGVALRFDKLWKPAVEGFDE